MMAKVYLDEKIQATYKKILDDITSREILGNSRIRSEVKKKLIDGLDIEESEFSGEDNYWNNMINEILVVFRKKQYEFHKKSLENESPKENKKKPYLFVFRMESGYVSKRYELEILNKKNIRKIEKKETKENEEETMMINIIKLEE